MTYHLTILYALILYARFEDVFPIVFKHDQLIRLF